MSEPLHILVTGASRGIGAEIVAALDGHRVVGHSSKGGDGHQRVDHAPHGQGTSGGRSDPLIAADLADPAAPAALWREAVAALDGRVDVLVNNAGIFEAAPIALSDADWAKSWDRTMRVNLTAAGGLCRLAVNHFRERGGGGRIVNISSRAGYRGDSPDHWAYAASKGGMVAMTKTIARAYAAEGIYAYTVCPGFTVTGMVEDYVASRGGIAALGDLPIGRPATASEVAETVRWLATSAPPSATGAVIDVNGASFVR
ncbi:SDR family oxidoreductase [Sphingosinicella sp. LHD-64]|uniref:SDR family NAD(P)-dependent oxidoreductase n=1 Tax=Sphingosinicella sp. LHD-64 TaxID=3072139 RepID=UPI00280E4BE1|nr:SDR family oxidoreductase [Sphingosinicella sp. LHD-64]MDQ8755949.1 SDR family oxidoreductase [Sphingosinicella sp. LHD-64]